MITIKSPAEIAIMAEGGEKLRSYLKSLASQVRPGVTTDHLEQLAQDLIRRNGGQSTFKGFHGYPAVTCISVNEEVVHGIPGQRIINEGDLVGIDFGLRHKGYCTDTALTVGVGKISKEAEQLLKVTQEALAAGIDQVKPGNRIGDISFAIQSVIDKYGYGIVRDLAGHGIGREQWEEPTIHNFGKAGTGPVLKEGMTIAIEPMVTLGNSAVKQLADGWTIVTLDGSLAAHFEQTIAVTKDGYQILT
jgi:methionyl aminopeptidase